MTSSKQSGPGRRRLLAAMAAAVALGAGIGIAAAREIYKSVEPVLSAGETVLGQPFAYPAGAAARVTAVIVTLRRGEETGLHRHGVPLFGYMLQGELTVDYQGHGSRVYRAGDSLIEAIGTPHNGRNTGTGDTRILAVFMGAEGRPNSEKVE